MGKEQCILAVYFRLASLCCIKITVCYSLEIVLGSLMTHKLVCALRGYEMGSTLIDLIQED